MSSEITISAMVDRLDGLEERWKKAAVRGLKSAAMRGVQEIQTRIILERSPMPVDRATYKAGWRFYGTPDGAVIENLEPHAIFIEEGVRAENVKIGKKMIAALAEWAERKKIVGKGKGTEVAWAIAKTMQRRGIFRVGQGLGILRELVEQYLPRFIEEEVAREVEREGI